jgi:tRNA 2-(methylsulfanyl)-N6-isopentenyladenosine37 hydroxylase
MSAQGEDSILRAATPEAWIATACVKWRELLLDHANCEKKAASTALAFLFTYPEDSLLLRELSRLAREELRHFEQVEKLLRIREVRHRRLAPARYAASLRRHVAAAEPARKLDLLVVGALIEARSCERFNTLAPRLAEPMAELYRGLSESEARHHQLYVDLARRHAEAHELDLDGRVAVLAQVEAALILSPDPQFRFHSGVPEQI